MGKREQIWNTEAAIIQNVGTVIWTMWQIACRYIRSGEMKCFRIFVQKIVIAIAVKWQHIIDEEDTAKLLFVGLSLCNPKLKNINLKPIVKKVCFVKTFRFYSYHVISIHNDIYRLVALPQSARHDLWSYWCAPGWLRLRLELCTYSGERKSQRVIVYSHTIRLLLWICKPNFRCIGKRV